MGETAVLRERGSCGRSLKGVYYVVEGARTQDLEKDDFCSARAVNSLSRGRELPGQ